MLFVVVLSASTAFAASDDAIISEVTDETNNDLMELSNDDEFGVDEAEEVIGDSSSDEILSEESSNVVTNDTFFNYFENEGTLKESVTDDELIFEGDFTGIGVNYITINKEIKFTGKNAIFVDVPFIVYSNNVKIDGFDLTGSDSALIMIGGTNVTISNTKLNFTTINEEDMYALYAEDVENLKLLNNTITYAGNYSAVLITNGRNILLEKNTFDIKIVSSYNSGIKFVSCENLTFCKNVVDLKYTSRSGSSDTLYVVEVDDRSSDVKIVENSIDALGGMYVYGVNVKCSDFVVENNNLNIVSDVHYVCGVNPDAGASGVVKGNVICVVAPNVVYGIYSGMWYATSPLVVNYTDNVIDGRAFFACGLELGGVKEIVSGNNITVDGNYSIGVAVYKYVQSTIDTNISNNVIVASASNIGNASSVYDNVGVETAGIKVVTGNITVSNNNIQTTGDYAINLGDANATVSSNYLSGKKGVGKSAIIGEGNIIISENSPELKSILSVVDLYTEYVSGGVVYVQALDETGDKIINVTIFATIDGVVYNETTDDNGVAAFVVDLDAGSYEVVYTFEGNDKYGPKTTTSMIFVDQSATEIIAPVSKSVLLTAVKSGSYITLTLMDMNGNWLGGKKVSITFNGKTNAYTTNDLGVIKYKLSATKVGNYALKMNFAGDKNYVGSTATTNIKITKEATKISAKSVKTTYKKSASKKIKITLKNSKNKSLGKVKITLKVNKNLKGKIGKKLKKGYVFTVKFNNKGIGYITLKNKQVNGFKKGTYKFTVSYKGNNLYKAATNKNIKMKIK